MAESAAPLLATLKAIVGEPNVLTSDADVAPYVTDWRGRYRGRTRAVVRPSTTADVAAVVRCCVEHGAPIVPQGGNTGLCGGATPREGGGEVVVSLSRLTRVRAVDTGNATLTVEAGMPLASVQQAADDAGLLFPLSLAAEGSCPIGGTSATALAAVADVDAAIALLGLLRQALGERLTGFELISGDCIALTRKQCPALPDPVPGYPWYALMQGDDPATDAPLAVQIEATLGAAVEQHVAGDAAIAQSAAQAAELWALREHIPEAQRLEGPNIKHDVSLPVSRIPSFLADAQVALGSALRGVRYVVFGHLG